MFIIISSKPRNGKTKTIKTLFEYDNNKKVFLNHSLDKTINEQVLDAIEEGYINIYIDDYILFKHAKFINLGFSSFKEQLFNDLQIYSHIYNINIYITDNL